MQTFHRLAWFTVSGSILAWGLVAPAYARQTTVTGGATAAYDFRERSYDQESNVSDPDEGDKRKAGIGPVVTVVSQGVRDSLSLRYAPLINYDSISEDSGVDHRLNLKGERRLSPFWRFAVTDNFIRSDDPSETTSSYEPATDSGGDEAPVASSASNDRLSRDLSGRKYWTNTASALTDYTLSPRSRVGGGYSYSVLRNDEGNDNDGYDDYDKHSVFSDFSHGFNQNWRSSLWLNYIRGLYDENTNGTGPSTGTPDLDQYNLSLGVDYIRDLTDFFPLKYFYSGTQYDGDTRRDNQVHNWSAGWDHAFDSRTRLALGGGPSFAKTQGLDGTWGYNAYCHFTRRYEHASFALLLDKLYDTQNFTGSDDSGVIDTYRGKALFTYQYTQALAFDLYGMYSLESTFDPQGEFLIAADGTGQTTGDVTYDKDIYEAGTGVSYSFAQWYKAGVKYVYYVSDGNLASDQYTDHRILFTLPATKDLWHW